MNDKKTFELALILGIVAFALCAIWSRNTKGEMPTITQSADTIASAPIIHYDTVIISKPAAPPYSISQYDPIFKHFGDSIGWDWKWLAAIAYTESHFNADAVNPSGAFGLMQLMPKTAADMGIDSLHRGDPYLSVRAAARLFKQLDTRFDSVSMPDRVCFVLASYNAGQGHVLDAMRLAEKHGSDKHRWYGSVEHYLTLKNEPEYYNDSVCHNGRFSGRETTMFVHNVWEKYKEYSRLEGLYDNVNTPDTLLVTGKK